MTDEREVGIFDFILLIALISGFSLGMIYFFDIKWTDITGCEGEAGSQELYYYEAYDDWDDSYECKIGNHTIDKIKEKQNKENLEKQKKIELERKECYEQGEDYNISLDLIDDYKFNCEQIAYINDHLILDNEKKNGGSIDTRNSGFFSSYTTNVKLYDFVNVEYLATGKLIKNAKYHLDCKNSTLYWKAQTFCDNGKIFPDETNDCWNAKEKIRNTKIIDYYNPSDFVMYYTNECLRSDIK